LKRKFGVPVVMTAVILLLWNDGRKIVVVVTYCAQNREGAR
jgi:hypothetical protein